MNILIYWVLFIYLDVNCDAVIPHYLDVALTYCFKNCYEFEDRQYTLFINIGSSYSDCTLIKYDNKYDITVLNHKYSEKICGSLIDTIFVDYIKSLMSDIAIKEIDNDNKKFSKFIKTIVKEKEKYNPENNSPVYFIILVNNWS